MRKVSILKIVLFSCLLFLTAMLAQYTEHKHERSVKESLNAAFESLPGWNVSPAKVIGGEIEKALHLDDYMFRSYTRGNDAVSLYVGYYRSAAKVGAAHDPLVCFTGQGWRFTERGEGTYMPSGTDKLVVNYSTMIAELRSDKEFVLYWFQTNGTTSAGTFDQKMQMLWQRLCKVPREENAFVRISTKLDGDSPESSKKIVFEFIDTFYPRFHRYVGT